MFADIFNLFKPEIPPVMWWILGIGIFAMLIGFIVETTLAFKYPEQWKAWREVEEREKERKREHKRKMGVGVYRAARRFLQK